MKELIYLETLKVCIQFLRPDEAKEIEIYQTDNKVISFAEWLTGERAIRLMELYGEFEEEFYPKEKL